jgi:hypothetical protein
MVGVREDEVWSCVGRIVCSPVEFISVHAGQVSYMNVRSFVHFHGCKET